MTVKPRAADIARTILHLCRQRGPEKTICPSEVARALAGETVHWRDLMEDVRQEAGRLAEEGRIEVCQKGRVIGISEARGPIRLRWRPSQE